VSLPHRLPAYTEHRGDRRPADTTTSEAVDLLVDELGRTTRISDQVDQPQQMRSGDRRTRRRLPLLMLADAAALTTTHDSERCATRITTDVPTNALGARGDVRGDGHLLMRAAAGKAGLDECNCVPVFSMIIFSLFCSWFVFVGDLRSLSFGGWLGSVARSGSLLILRRCAGQPPARRPARTTPDPSPVPSPRRSFERIVIFAGTPAAAKGRSATAGRCAATIGG
jgi:hypothetical protein